MTPRTVRRPIATDTAGSCDQAQTAGFAGLISGAQLLTLKGAQAVETLCVGDRILTRNGAVPVTRIDMLSALVPAVYVIAGSLGHSRSDRDALLSADQMVFLHDWRAPVLRGRRTALVPAHALVDGEFVRDVGQQLVTLYRIFCDAPQILFADGLTLGTADAVASTAGLQAT
ncbi:Hint domain-containing protein [uncultured Roseobacter sp.]|uniref:Hint domain-containing protein n=1 Tax=uncultured Roseobacter sp. TaxID=114847 RepID=UPI00260E7099|nr:Hint domain-containing protein [uncultured Roseobacter sp.]